MEKSSSVKPLANVMKLVTLLLMLLSIVTFIGGAWFISIGIIFDPSEVSSDDAFANAILNFLLGGKYDISMSKFVLTFLDTTLGNFVAIFVCAQLRKYFKNAEINSNWYYDGAKKSLIKVLITCVFWFAIPYAVSECVNAALPKEIFDLSTNINIAAIVVAALTAIALVKNKTHHTEILTENEE